MPIDFPHTLPHLAHLQDGRAYYEAAAPDGTPLHGSSALKRYRESPLKYLRWAWARTTIHSCRMGWGNAMMREQAEQVLREFEPSRYMNFGSIVDAYVFKQHAECRKIEQNEKIETVTRARMRMAALRSHPEIGPYICSRTLIPQVSHVWQDAQTGIWCRARFDAIDYVDCQPTYWDLKVWSACKPGMCRWNIDKFGVDIQMALYRRAARDLWGISPRQGLLVCGPKVDDEMYLRWITSADIDEWDEELSRTMERLKHSYETGDFSESGSESVVGTLARQEIT